jgi:P pilus assembly chaperone PapD
MRARIFPFVPLILLISSPMTQLANASAAQPAAPAVAQQQSWHSLAWVAKEGKLTVTNTGSEPVHLSRDVKLMPDEMALTLTKTTLLPGETLEVNGACRHHLPQQKQVAIALLSAAGSAEEALVLPLKHE